MSARKTTQPSGFAGASSVSSVTTPAPPSPVGDGSAARVDGSAATHAVASRRAGEALEALRNDYRDAPLDVSFRHLTGPLPADDLTHSLYPYPARLVRHIPRLLTRAPQLVPEGATVIDPFCGSGTVLLEAMSAGHHAVGVDANPLAALVASVKTTVIDGDTLIAAGQVLAARAKAERRRDLNRPDFRSVLQARMEHDEQEVFAGDA